MPGRTPGERLPRENDREVAEGVGVEGGNQEEREGCWRGLGHSLGGGRAAGTPVGYGGGKQTSPPDRNVK